MYRYTYEIPNISTTDPIVNKHSSLVHVDIKHFKVEHPQGI